VKGEIRLPGTKYTVLPTGEIGYTSHEGREGWTWQKVWAPGDPAQQLVDVIQYIYHKGMQERTDEIATLLGIKR
jgi:hypothetical protein